MSFDRWQQCRLCCHPLMHGGLHWWCADLLEAMWHAILFRCDCRLDAAYLRSLTVNGVARRP